MTAGHESRGAINFDLVGQGPSHRLGERLGFAGPPARRRIVKVALLILATWAPLALLSWLRGTLYGEAVSVPFFHDLEVHVRFLIVLPLLELARSTIAVSLSVQARHLASGGLIPEPEQPRFEAARSEALAARGSWLAEAILVVLAYLAAVVFRVGLGFSEGLSSWERSGASLTSAGYWHTLVSLPVLYFFLLRWAWVFLLWARFLYRVSRLELALTPTHPDRTGGLGFLGWGLAGFGTVLLAVSAVVASGIVHQVVLLGDSPESMKNHVIVFTAGALLVLHAPHLAFAGRLARCRFRGMLEFGALAWEHDRAFDEKWIERPPHDRGPKILGSADIQSMADIATCFEHVNRMWLIPFDAKAFAVLALAALLPMVALVGTAVPFREVFRELAEFLI